MYREALNALISLDKQSSLSLAERLLEEFAEVGDEIVFSPDYKFAAEVAALGVIKEKSFQSPKRARALTAGSFSAGKIPIKTFLTARCLPPTGKRIRLK